MLPDMAKETSDVIKDLEMRIILAVWMYSKYNHKHPYNREERKI